MDWTRVIGLIGNERSVDSATIVYTRKAITIQLQNESYR